MKRIIKRLKELYRSRHELAAEARWLGKKSHDFLGRILLVFLVGCILSAITIGITLVNKRLIDGATSGNRFDAVSLGLLVGLTLVNLLAGSGTAYLAGLLQEKLSMDMCAGMYRHVLHSRWLEIGARHSGDILTRLTADVSTVSSGLCSLIPDFLSMAVRMVLAFCVLFRFDRMLAIAALVLGPIVVLTGLMFSGRLSSFERKLRENESEYRSFMQESTENVMVIKAFCAEPVYERRLDELRSRQMRLIRRRGLLSMLMRLSMNLVFSSGYLLAFGWGIWQISRGRITYGTMSVFLALVSQIQGPIATMGNLVPRLIGILTSAGRLMELEAIGQEEADGRPAPDGALGIRFRDVTFGYRGNEVLRSIDFDIRPGETVGLLGETGAGKTTIARLVMALIEPDRGCVSFYNDAGSEVTASVATRAAIAYVPQGNTLSSGTIRANLQLGAAQADDAELRRALRSAEAEGFVRELPDGPDTVIGEKGIGLSEGQAQRIAIARALLRDTPVLILDEATASLDTETETRIMNNLRNYTGDRTCLVITHRPSLLQLCDRCLCIEDGTIRPV